jgi:hypothetical protein
VPEVLKINKATLKDSFLVYIGLLIYSDETKGNEPSSGRRAPRTEFLEIFMG